MFTNLVIVILSLTTVFGAHIRPRSSCDTGSTLCCDNIQQPGSEEYGWTANELGLSGTAVPIGIGCVPISVIGAGAGSSCLATPACCEQSTGGTVGLDCVPIALGV